jgi:hypothetical protein
MAKVKKKGNKKNDKAIVLLPEDPNAFVKDNICDYLEEGMWKKDAAELAGITERTFYRWCEEDVSFVSRVQLSILKYKRNLIKVINLGSIKKPEVAIRVMEQRWPEEWRQTKKVEVVDPDAQLAKTLSTLLGGTPTKKEDIINDSDEPNTTSTTGELQSSNTEESAGEV